MNKIFEYCLLKFQIFGSNIILRKLKYKMETALGKFWSYPSNYTETLFRSHGMFVIKISKGGIFIALISWGRNASKGSKYNKSRIKPAHALEFF